MSKILTTALLAAAILAFAPIPEADSHKLSASASQARSGAGAPPAQGGTSTAIKIGLLQLTKSTIRYKGRKGDRYHQTYQSGDITANVECIATGFGDTHSVDCNATITVVKGDQKQVVKAVGDCGC